MSNGLELRIEVVVVGMNEHVVHMEHQKFERIMSQEIRYVFPEKVA